MGFAFAIVEARDHIAGGWDRSKNEQPLVHYDRPLWVVAGKGERPMILIPPSRRR
jgi:hypothetical protein